MVGVEVRARAGSVQPNVAKIGDQRGSSAEVLGMSAAECARDHSTTFGVIPWHSAERLNSPPGVGPYSRWLAVNTDDRMTASSTCLR